MASKKQKKGSKKQKKPSRKIHANSSSFSSDDENLDDRAEREHMASKKRKKLSKNHDRTMDDKDKNDVTGRDSKPNHKENKNGQQNKALRTYCLRPRQK